MPPAGGSKNVGYFTRTPGSEKMSARTWRDQKSGLSSPHGVVTQSAGYKATLLQKTTTTCGMCACTLQKPFRGFEVTWCISQVVIGAVSSRVGDAPDSRLLVTSSTIKMYRQSENIRDAVSQLPGFIFVPFLLHGVFFTIDRKYRAETVARWKR